MLHNYIIRLDGTQSALYIDPVEAVYLQIAGAHAIGEIFATWKNGDTILDDADKFADDLKAVERLLRRTSDHNARQILENLANKLERFFRQVRPGMRLVKEYAESAPERQRLLIPNQVYLAYQVALNSLSDPQQAASIAASLNMTPAQVDELRQHILRVALS
jgi:hypothetical protein